MNGKGYDQEGTLASFYLDGRSGFAAPEVRPGGFVSPEGRPGGGFPSPDGRTGGYGAPEGRPGGGYAEPPLGVPDERLGGGFAAPEGRPAAGAYGPDGRPVAGGGGMHSIQVLNREQTVIQGVTAVETFDDEEIVLETEMGGLTLRGEELQIRQLDLESGKFAVDGLITALIYTAPRQRGGRPNKGRSFLERLLK